MVKAAGRRYAIRMKASLNLHHLLLILPCFVQYNIFVLSHNDGYIKEERKMRSCLRCHAEMVEDLDVKVEGGAYGLKVTQQGILKENLGKFKCAVCPECGYTETYIQDPAKIKKLALNEK